MAHLNKKNSSLSKRKKALAFESEAELAREIVKWLEKEGWTVYKEVLPKRLTKIADIVGVKDDKIWVIETKLAFGSKVIEQAYYWKSYADYVSIAVPTSNGDRNIVLNFFMEEKGIGCFKVTKGWDENSSWIHESKKAKLIEKNMKSYIVESLTEAHKESVAGSFGGGYITPYKQTIDQVKALLKREGAKTVKEIVASVKHHYSSDAVARNTLSKRLFTVEDEFELINVDGILKIHLKAI